MHHANPTIRPSQQLPNPARRALVLALAVPAAVAVIEVIAIGTLVATAPPRPSQATIVPADTPVAVETRTVETRTAVNSAAPSNPSPELREKPEIIIVTEPRAAIEPSPEISATEAAEFRPEFLGQLPPVVATSPPAPPTAETRPDIQPVRKLQPPDYSHHDLVGQVQTFPGVGFEPMDQKKITLVGTLALRLNKQSHDSYIRHVISDKSTGVEGMPFLLGASCRTSDGAATDFTLHADAIQHRLRQVRQLAFSGERAAESFWKRVLPNGASAKAPDSDRRWLINGTQAFQQIIPAQDDAIRRRWVELLEEGQEPIATKTLARIALYELNPKVRRLAIGALRSRPGTDFADTLVDGFRYPWATVAWNAAEALVELDRKDLVPRLQSVAAEGDPYTAPKAGGGGRTIREAVKVHHRRNCFLCHPPIEKPAALRAVEEGTFSVGAVAEETSAEYYETPTDIFVRADITYLRQDFSVAIESPSGTVRYDILVRHRTLTPRESKARPAADSLDQSLNGDAVRYAIQQLAANRD